MKAATFIGDELTGAGFRLAGLRVQTPDPERLLEVFRQALLEASLLIVTQEFASRIPTPELYEAVMRAEPPVAIVAQATRAGGESELVREVHITLGMEA